MGRKYYAVRKGREPGLYTSLAECKQQVADYPDCEYEIFTRKSLAEAYLVDILEKPAPVVRKAPEKPPKKFVYRLEYDGACKGNPGKAGAGALLRQPDGTVVQELTIGLGEATSNFAEYHGLILGLKAALERNVSCIQVQGDSNLVCKQVAGKWAVKNEKLVLLHAEVQALVKQFSKFSIRHVAREFNAAADALANKGVHLKCFEVSSTEMNLKPEVSGTPLESSTTSKSISVDLIDEKTISLEERSTKKKKTKTKSVVEEDLVYRLEYDGASKGNPGRAGAGALLRDPTGSVIEELTIGLGETTNNVAEYEGLILGLQAALKRKISRIQVQGDSNLVCKQVEGKWAVRNEKLIPLHAKAQALIKKFQEFEIRHVMRELNAAADNLANEAVNAQGTSSQIPMMNVEQQEEPVAAPQFKVEGPTISLRRQMETDLKIGSGEEEAFKPVKSRAAKSKLGPVPEPRILKKLENEEDLIYQVEYDGASKGNPGKAGAGALLRHPNGSVIEELTMGLGFETNNVAEYRALILGLQAALDKKITHIQVIGDSSLVCNQVGGAWGVKDATLASLHAQVQGLTKQFSKFSIHHIQRELNTAADTLANRAAKLRWNEVKVKTKPARRSVKVKLGTDSLESETCAGKSRGVRASASSSSGLLTSRHKLSAGFANLQAACRSYHQLRGFRTNSCKLRATASYGVWRLAALL